MSVADRTERGASGPACSSEQELRSGSGGPGVIHTDCAAESETEVPACRGATVFGMVPDGVPHVDVRLESGNAVRADVANNAYLVDVPADPVAVEFETPAGNVRQVAP